MSAIHCLAGVGESVLIAAARGGQIKYRYILVIVITISTNIQLAPSLSPQTELQATTTHHLPLIRTLD